LMMSHYIFIFVRQESMKRESHHYISHTASLSILKAK
jgi:hypothetical protein